jgi:hypothetical protein
MDKFVSFIVNLPKTVKPQTDVRVAIIDDGTDFMQQGHFNDSIKEGRSFFTKQNENHTRIVPYYFSSTGHGTLMAEYVLRICPKAHLYIARLDQGYCSNGTLQLTADSAAKVIYAHATMCMQG